MFRRRLVFWILTVCLLAVAIPAMGERAPSFDTWWETAEYLRELHAGQGEGNSLYTVGAGGFDHAEV